MIIKLGDVNIAGPGFQVAEVANKSNFTVGGGRGGSCATATESSKRTLDYKVHARGGCDLGLARAYELAERIQDELDLANANRGHMLYYKKLDNYTLRRELMGGKIDYVNMELQYSRKRIVAMDISVEIQDSVIIGPVLPANISGGEWTDTNEVYKAVLVTTGSSVLTEPAPNFLAGYATLDEFAGANYARVELPATGRTISGDQYHAADISFPRLGNDNLPIGAVVIIRLVNDDTDSPVTGVLPLYESFNPNGLTTTFKVNAKGLFDISLV